MAGLLHVSAQILEPRKLSVEAFDEWYEEEHAPEVLALPGFPSAVRWVSLPRTPSSPTSPPTTPDTTQDATTHLTTYPLPSLSSTTSPAFIAVASTPPPPSLVEKIYANTVFDIRFYASFAPDLLACPTSPSSPALNSDNTGPVKLLANITFPPHHTSGQDPGFEIWFAGKFAVDVKSLPGFLALRRYGFVNGVVRERNVVLSQTGVGEEERKGWLAMVEFDGTAGEGVRGVVEKVVREGEGEGRVEWFAVKRVLGEGGEVVGRP